MITFQVSPIQVLVASAIINSLTYAFLVLFKKDNRIANRFLCLLLASLSLTFTPYFLNETLYNKHLWLAWLPFSLTYWIGPCLYFYIRSLTLPKAHFLPKYLWHFSLIALNYIHSIYHAFTPQGDPLPSLHRFSEFLEYFAIVSVLYYTWLSYKLLSSYGKSILDQLSSLESLHLRWIRNLIKTLAALFLALALFIVFIDDTNIEQFQHTITFKDVLLALYAIIMYWLSIGGYRQAQTINNPIDLSKNLNDENLNERVLLLTQQMKEEQYYLDPQLSLKTLSLKTGFSEREISNILKVSLNKNFYKFVNGYRIESVKDKLINPNNSHLKIISLAYDSGFNSKATFHRIFKLEAGISPQEFRNRNS